MYDIPTRHAEARRARVIDETGVEKSMLASPTVQEREMRGTSHIWSGGLTGHRCEKHGESTPNHTIGPSQTAMWRVPTPCYGMPRLEAASARSTAHRQGTGPQRALTCSWPTSSLSSSGMDLNHHLLSARPTPQPPSSSGNLDAARFGSRHAVHPGPSGGDCAART